MEGGPQERWQRAGVWLGEGSIPQFHSHRLLPHPIFKPEKKKKKNQTRMMQVLIPISPLRLCPPLLLGPGYPRSAPSPIQPGLPLNCSLSLLPSPCQLGNPSCAYSTLSPASASGSGCAHSPLLRKSPVSIFLQLPWPFSLVVLATPTPMYFNSIWTCSGFSLPMRLPRPRDLVINMSPNPIDIFQGLDTAVPSSPLAVVYTSPDVCASLLVSSPPP